LATTELLTATSFTVGGTEQLFCPTSFIVGGTEQVFCSTSFIVGGTEQVFCPTSFIVGDTEQLFCTASFIVGGTERVYEGNRNFSYPIEDVNRLRSAPFALVHHSNSCLTKTNTIMAEWSYLQNQFNNSTKENFSLMLALGNDHIAKLEAQQADADIAALLARTQPLQLDYSKAYTKWKSATAIRKGATLKIDQLLAELSSLKIKQWDIQIQGQYLDGTPEYMALLPEKRGPFQKGAKDQRINAVEALNLRLGDYPVLAATQADVDAFRTQLVDARDEQQQKEQLIEQGSDDLEKARVELAIMMYGNLGVLMDKYRNTPDYINNYWEVSLMQNTPPPTREFGGTVAADATANLTQTVGPNAKAVLTNTGYTVLTFCLAATNADACATGVQVQPGDTLQVERASLGEDGDANLNVTNMSPDAEGAYSVEVIG